MKTNLTFATPDRADELDVFRAIYADLLRTPSCLAKVFGERGPFLRCLQITRNGTAPMCAALPRSIKRPFQKHKPKGKLDMKNVIITGSSNGFG
jgi:hypothetical protein